MFSSYRFWAKHRQIVRENAKNVDYLPKSSFYSTSVNDLSKTRLCKSRRQYFQNLKLCLMSSKKIYQELFNIQYYSLESGPITLLERDEECVKKLTFYDKTHGFYWLIRTRRICKQKRASKVFFSRWNFSNFFYFFFFKLGFLIRIFK